MILKRRSSEVSSCRMKKEKNFSNKMNNRSIKKEYKNMKKKGKKDKKDKKLKSSIMTMPTVTLLPFKNRTVKNQ